MTAMADDYEYEERAAIRCFDGNIEEFEANQLALLDLKDRSRKEQEPAEQKPPAKLPADKKEAMEVLRGQAHELSSEMGKTKSEKKQSLFVQWLEVQNKIIALRRQ